ncbi:hypothetical protein EV127DRAFT_226486 [Xylaria flabelliformis]|nr:hypothetical protein EV127DRAFT_226486 [Xylaria flabelliformis]
MTKAFTSCIFTTAPFFLSTAASFASQFLPIYTGRLYRLSSDMGGCFKRPRTGSLQSNIFKFLIRGASNSATTALKPSFLLFQVRTP